METFCSSNVRFIYLYYHTHDFLFHTVSYDLIITIYFNVQIVSDGVRRRSPFKLARVFLTCLHCSRNHDLLSGTRCPSSGTSHSAKEPRYEQWYESHHLGARYGHCYWGVTVPNTLEDVCTHCTPTSTCQDAAEIIRDQEFTPPRHGHPPHLVWL